MSGLRLIAAIPVILKLFRKVTLPRGNPNAGIGVDCCRSALDLFANEADVAVLQSDQLVCILH